MPRYVITGASGGGKSTLLAALAAKGLQTVPEAGRQIVREQTAAGGNALPQENPQSFAKLLFERSLAAYDRAPDGDVFFDRSFIEPLAFLRQSGLPVPPEWDVALRQRRLAEPVFVAPPWEEIYKTDAERTHDFTFAIADHSANVAAYKAEGYRLINLPKAPVSERVNFVLANICPHNM